MKTVKNKPLSVDNKQDLKSVRRLCKQSLDSGY